MRNAEDPGVEAGRGKGEAAFARDLAENGAMAAREERGKGQEESAKGKEGRGEEVRTHDIEHRTSNIERPTSNQEPGTANQEPRTTNHEPRTVLFVGHLALVKGVDRLIDAWSILISKLQHLTAEADAPRLVVIGAGPLRGRMERMARKAGISDSVRFLGAIPHAEVARRMNAAHCLCLPSRSEGMPNVVLEAMASGLPVVATAVGEVPFLVKDGETGFVVNGEDDVPARLAAALMQALEKKWERRQIALATNAFTWEDTAAKILGAIA